MSTTLKSGYVKDGTGDLISPITSSKTILMPNGWSLEEALSNQRLAIIQYICNQVKTLPDEEILKYEAVFPDWTVGMTLSNGDVVRYKNKLYRVFETHIAQVDKTPDDVNLSDTYGVVYIDNGLKSYTVELSRWGINGDPTNNSNGINEALVWASQEGYSEIIFPAMEYVIDELIPIYMQNMNDVTVNLNGSTLRIKLANEVKTKNQPYKRLKSPRSNDRVFQHLPGQASHACAGNWGCVSPKVLIFSL